MLPGRVGTLRSRRASSGHADQKPQAVAVGFEKGLDRDVGWNVMRARERRHPERERGREPETLHGASAYVKTRHP